MTFDVPDHLAIVVGREEGLVRAMKANRSLISAEQVPFDRIEQLAAETRGLDERQLRLFDLR